MRERISRTALFGERTRSPRIAAGGLRKTMAALLAEIESGEFAAEWLRTHASGRSTAEWGAASDASGRDDAPATDEAIERVGREIRRRTSRS
jgi:ketol-acid reductoisomerase